MTKLWIGKQVSSYQGLGMVGESVMDVIIKWQLVRDFHSHGVVWVFLFFFFATSRPVLGGLVTKSCPTLTTPWTVACQAPQSIGFSRQEYWSGLPFPSPGDLPEPGIEPRSPALQAVSLPTELPEKPLAVAF